MFYTVSVPNPGGQIWPSGLGTETVQNMGKLLKNSILNMDQEAYTSAHTLMKRIGVTWRSV